ncbi:LuxR family transcriptional regulator [Vibrio sp. PP-XX7]
MQSSTMVEALNIHFQGLQAITKAMGFEALIYDYSPVPIALDGELITPSLLRMEQAPEDMQTLWCDEGYYQIDPVQQYSLKTNIPFVWSYRNPERTVLRASVNPHDRVCEYMNDNDMACGITVPLHLPDGSFATLTGMVSGLDRERELEGALARFGLLALQFHEKIYPYFDAEIRRCPLIDLTPREKECLAYAAEGMTAKEIAAKIYRSVPTVTLHLNTAIRKLGAANRVQAVVRAMHYRLLD